jgi:type IV pilus assembly protein PilW
MKKEKEKERERAATQQGMTLIECMIALTLGMLVILASTALFLSAQKTYLAIDDSARIGDTGAFAMDALAAAIRQANYANYADYSGAGAMTPPKPPGNTLFGLDDTTLMGRSQYPARIHGINGSDALFTRFMATDATGAIDPNMLNCAGHSAKHASAPGNAEASYNWSIFYIALDRSDEPELFCRYRSKNNTFGADAIARDVDSMQFLYGVDHNQDGLPDTFLDADAIAASDWQKVVAVDITLSVRGRGAESKTGRSPSSRLFHRTIILRNPSEQ